MGYFYQEEDLVYCWKYVDLLGKLGAPQYDLKDLRLFTATGTLWSVRSSTTETRFSSIPLVHFTNLKEKYEAVKYVLDFFQCEQDQ